MHECLIASDLDEQSFFPRYSIPYGENICSPFSSSFSSDIFSNALLPNFISFKLHAEWPFRSPEFPTVEFIKTMSRERWNSKNPSTIPEVGKQNSNFLNHGIFGHHTVIIGPRFCVAVLDVLQHSIITRRERKLRNFSKCCLQSVKKDRTSKLFFANGRSTSGRPGTLRGRARRPARGRAAPAATGRAPGPAPRTAARAVLMTGEGGVGWGACSGPKNASFDAKKKKGGNLQTSANRSNYGLALNSFFTKS